MEYCEVIFNYQCTNKNNINRMNSKRILMRGMKKDENYEMLVMHIRFFRLFYIPEIWNKTGQQRAQKVM